jgi:hypothetical protein
MGRIALSEEISSRLLRSFAETSTGSRATMSAASPATGAAMRPRGRRAAVRRDVIFMAAVA